jgi:hypothetical protein
LPLCLGLVNQRLVVSALEEVCATVSRSQVGNAQPTLCRPPQLLVLNVTRESQAAIGQLDERSVRHGGEVAPDHSRVRRHVDRVQEPVRLQEVDKISEPRLVVDRQRQLSSGLLASRSTDTDPVGRDRSVPGRRGLSRQHFCRRGTALELSQIRRDMDVVQVQKNDGRVAGGHLKTRHRAGITAAEQDPADTNDGRAKQGRPNEPETIPPDASSDGVFRRVIAHRMSIRFPQAAINSGVAAGARRVGEPLRWRTGGARDPAPFAQEDAGDWGAALSVYLAKHERPAS